MIVCHSYEAGLVRYELMSRERGEESDQPKPFVHEMVGDKSLGTFLVEHLGDRAIRVEILPGKTPDQVEGFTGAALIYRR